MHPWFRDPPRETCRALKLFALRCIIRGSSFLGESQEQNEDWKDVPLVERGLATFIGIICRRIEIEFRGPFARLLRTISRYE